MIPHSHDGEHRPIRRTFSPSAAEDVRDWLTTDDLRSLGSDERLVVPLPRYPRALGGQLCWPSDDFRHLRDLRDLRDLREWRVRR